VRIDLNSDIGESFGPYSVGHDDAILDSVTSVNVACGFHAGDPSVMRRTVRKALARGVAIGAHPGFPDLQGFGRRAMAMSPAEVEDAVLYQVAALIGVAAAEGGRVTHVKAHGALYNMAVSDPSLAGAIASAVRALDPNLVLFGLPGSCLLAAGCAAGLRVAAEGFADRAYEADGSLTPRSRDGAVLHEPSVVLMRALDLVRAGRVEATDGSVLSLAIQTLCLHGDSIGAADLGAVLRRGLEAHGVRVAALVAA